jgi:hypothetical protein
MSEFIVSVIRTVVPTVVGAAIAWAMVHGLGWANLGSYQDQVSAWLVVACISGYYALARWLEERYPWAGLLLGVARRPAYPAAEPDRKVRRAEYRP